MKKLDFSIVKNVLRSSSRVLITTHHNPDGDAVGSAMGLYHYLIQEKHLSVNVLIPNQFPDFLKWIPASDQATIFERSPKEGKNLINNADLIFCLDYNAFERVGDFADMLREARGTRIMIDHHPNPGSGFDFTFSTINTSSTAELVYDFITELGGTESLNRNIAECIYAGIVTDTGSFSYLCNHEKTYRVVAELIKLGIDGEHIHRLVYDTFSEDRLRLLGFCLSERMIVLPEYHTAYIYLSESDLKRFNYQIGDLEGVVNYPLSIKNVKFSVLFREQPRKIRMSLRSKGEFAVNEFAESHFKGGGHKNAAGSDSFLTLKETLDKFESLLPQYKEQLDRI